LLFCKGADSIIEALIEPETENNLATTKSFIEDYAKSGLRTLMLAQREISEQEYDQWSQR